MFGFGSSAIDSAPVIVYGRYRVRAYMHGEEHVIEGYARKMMPFKRGSVQVEGWVHPGYSDEVFEHIDAMDLPGRLSCSIFCLLFKPKDAVIEPLEVNFLGKVKEYEAVVTRHGNEHRPVTGFARKIFPKDEATLRSHVVQEEDYTCPVCINDEARDIELAVRYVGTTSFLSMTQAKASRFVAQDASAETIVV